MTTRVTTWNVLHRIHGLNWSEAPIAQFPDERARIAAISQTVAQWLAEGVDVVCLQEVSGDQLSSLRALGAHVFAHQYPRVPRLRAEGADGLVDRSEHLVTLVRAAGATQFDARTFESDPGKGFLAVELATGVAVINTHVSFGESGKRQLELLERVAKSREPVAVVGDFNAPVNEVSMGLGASFALSSVASPTRIATPQHPQGKIIDHVAVRGARIEAAHVLDAAGLSDHHPVRATTRP